MPDNKAHSSSTPGILAKLRKIFGLNIGTVMFGAILIYMIFSVILYLTASHMESYQVPSGPLSMNETYTGLSIMTENVVQADAGGYVTYYAREGTKINANGAVYSLNSSKAADSGSSLSKDELADIRSNMQSFSKGFDASKFNSTYSFKYQLSGSILQYASDNSSVSTTSTVNEDGEEVTTTTTTVSSDPNIRRAQTDGIILYSTGPLSMNETYTGLSIMTENVVQADAGGYVTYYAREGTKINANGAVYSLNSSKAADSGSSLSKDELADIRSNMQSFSKGFDASKFNSTYSFKYQLSGSILQYASDNSSVSTTSTVNEDGEEVTTTTTTVSSDPNIRRAQTDGIILYSTDGYESKTVDTVTAADFDQNSYQETDLKTDGQVNAGDDVYTIITDERWSLLIPLSEKQAANLKDRTSIRVKFLKDDLTQTGDFSIMEIDGSKYGRIDFNKGLIRYASDRFLEIELVTNNVTGLKVPLSSIVTKEFYAIPSKYMTTDKDTQQSGFMLSGRNKKGNSTTTFINTGIYGRDEVTDEKTQKVSYIYYVDKSKFNEGDAIIDPDSGEKFVIGDTEVLEGVYCINQGYAVFRRIEILDENEEYAVVSKETYNGLVRYDRIVKNADKVSEQDILY